MNVNAAICWVFGRMYKNQLQKASIHDIIFTIKCWQILAMVWKNIVVCKHLSVFFRCFSCVWDGTALKIQGWVIFHHLQGNELDFFKLMNDLFF